MDHYQPGFMTEQIYIGRKPCLLYNLPKQLIMVFLEQAEKRAVCRDSVPRTRQITTKEKKFRTQTQALTGNRLSFQATKELKEQTRPHLRNPLTRFVSA